MFSPYYALARRRGAADPMDYCALNVALYGAGGKRWVLTERGREGVARDASTFVIGPNRLEWNGASLTIDIDEVTVPLPRRVRGRVTVHAPFVVGSSFALDHAGRHVWRPVSPCAQVDVELDSPGLRWSGAGYFDRNSGAEPLEAAFTRWDWSRATNELGTTVIYDVTRRDGSEHAIAINVDRGGAVRSIPAPDRQELPSTRIWRVPRGTRCDRQSQPGVIETLEDTPFYARSLVATRLEGRQMTAVHESLSLDRFRLPIVQMMLPFKTLRFRR